jgi:hemerythrin-like domain-containing protein
MSPQGLHTSVVLDVQTTLALVVEERSSMLSALAIIEALLSRYATAKPVEYDPIKGIILWRTSQRKGESGRRLASQS